MDERLEIEDSLSINAFFPAILGKGSPKTILKMYLEIPTKITVWEILANVRAEREHSCFTFRKLFIL